jgi:hypothetical protein
MKLTKKIQRMIDKKLSFTNGWRIEERKYNELVKELTNEIILTIEEDGNRRQEMAKDRTDWKRNNKIGLRNFSESSDFHDIIKTLVVRLLRREHPDNYKIPIYTEHSPTKPNEEYPDIWMRIKNDIVVYEIQKKINKDWIKQISEKYEQVDLIIIETEKVLKEWKQKIHSKSNSPKTDPIKLLTNILQKYIV